MMQSFSQSPLLVMLYERSEYSEASVGLRGSEKINNS